MMRGDGEKGYPWFFVHMTRSWAMSLFTFLIVSGISLALYIWYNRYGSDPAPDGILGLSYALVGTTLLIIVALRYTLRRRSRNRAVGKLHSALNWHICLGILALVLLFLHSFGNFNPRSGTYALYGMIALVISGFIGRTLDHIMPRLITREVRKALTTQGEDRLEEISQKLQAIVVHNTQELHSFQAEEALPRQKQSRGMELMGMLNTSHSKEYPLHTSWDLAYISLEETPQELSRDAQHYRFVPDKKSSLTSPEALIPGAQEHISALHSVQQAMQREQVYRYIIRYWRIFHIALVLLTVGLILWHIGYAASLWIPWWLRR